MNKLFQKLAVIFASAAILSPGLFITDAYAACLPGYSGGVLCSATTSNIGQVPAVSSISGGGPVYTFTTVSGGASSTQVTGVAPISVSQVGTNATVTFNNPGYITSTPSILPGTGIGVATTTTSTTITATSTPSVTIYVDGNRTDTYTANGTIQYPFKTISAAVPSITQASTLNIAAGTYTEASAVSFPNYPLTVYGNGSTITFVGGITVTNPNYTRYDLNVVGNETYSASSTGRVLVQGGSITGNITTNGLTDFKSISLLSGTITVNTTSQMLAIASTLTSQIASKGITLLEDDNFNTSKSTPLISSTNGNVVIANNLITNTGTGGGISIANAGTNSVANNIISVASGAPVAVGTSTTIYSRNTIAGGVNTGTGYVPVNTDMIGGGTIMGLGSDATGDMYYRNSSGLLTRLGIGASSTVLSTNGAIPSWQTTPLTAAQGGTATTTALGTAAFTAASSYLPAASSTYFPSVATTTISKYDITPTTTDKIAFVVSANPFTIKRVLCYEDNSGDTVTYQIIHGSTNVFSSSQTCTATMASPQILTSFSSASVAAGETVYLTISAASSSATTWQLEY